MNGSSATITRSSSTTEVRGSRVNSFSLHDSPLIIIIIIISFLSASIIMYWSALYNMTCVVLFFSLYMPRSSPVKCVAFFLIRYFAVSIGLLAEMSATKSDRSTSPAASMSEDSRRDLLARQHRALYGNESPAFFPPGPLSDDHNRADSQATGTPSSAPRGSSPRGVDPFGLTQAGGAPAEGASGLQSPNRANSTSSPSSAINAGFTEQPGTSVSSPGAADSPSSSRQGSSKPSAGPIGSVGPIGSRPVPGQAPAAPAANPALNKQRSTTPLPSPLGFGFTPSEAAAAGERSTSATSNPAVTATNAPSAKDSSGGVGLGWSNNGGVWGSKSGLGVQASVWG